MRRYEKAMELRPEIKLEQLFEKFCPSDILPIHPMDYEYEPCVYGRKHALLEDCKRCWNKPYPFNEKVWRA